LLNTEYAVDGYYNGDVVRTIVSANVYNEAGMLKTKYLHSTSVTTPFMQKIDYKYNIRGWLTGINDPGLASGEGDRFGMKLGYNLLPDGTSGTGVCYNGNISGMKWGTPNYQNLQYNFTYDGANRLTQALFTGAGFSTYSFKTLYNYSKNGSIVLLRRYGNTSYPWIDNITYGYEGAGSCRLKYSNDSQGDVAGVEDFSGTLTGDSACYSYDPNGNLTLDDYKGLSITYNDNNLPQELDFGNNNSINYFYDATGEKMLRVVSDSLSNTNLTYYFGPFVHEGEQGGTSSLKYIMTPEGRIINKGSDGSPIWSWEYNLTDHLGNVRVVIAPLGTAGFSNVLQQTHYYPYGMQMSQISTSSGTDNDYLFGGKQLQDDFGLNWYSFWGRGNYDPALCIWRSPDPMAYLHPNYTPYNYCFNNPMRFIDPMGMDTINAVQPEAQEMIVNTVPPEDADYVQFDEDGNVDADLLNSNCSESGNYNDLQDIANSEKDVSVEISCDDKRKDDKGERDDVELTGQYDNNGDLVGFNASTRTPEDNHKSNDGESRSINNDVNIYVSPMLTTRDKLHFFSEELYGHAYIYMIEGPLKNKHLRSSQGGPNVRLENKIKQAQAETKKNYEKSKK
jgi:RHS repeat-associated protein